MGIEEVGGRGVLPPVILAWLGSVAAEADIELLIQVVQETAAFRSDGTEMTGHELGVYLQLRGLDLAVLPEGTIRWLGAGSAEELAELERVADQALAMKNIDE